MNGLHKPLAAVVLGCVLVATAGVAQARTAKASKAHVAKSAGAVTYLLGPKSMVVTLYPDASWLPTEYAKPYADLAATIEGYTLQSLQRDGVKDAKVQVSFVQQGDVEQVQVRITPANAVTRRYAQLHPRLLDDEHGQAALRAVQACMKSDTPSKCWDPQPVQAKPWAFYLPFGMAMANAKSIMFMDYPPVPALLAKDYLNNFTMCRWNQVLGGAGALDTSGLDVIIDSRPIAAPGSGEDALLPDPIAWFNGSTGADYLTPMLQLLTARPDGAGTTTLPVTVFGGTARKTWGRIVGKDNLKILDVGETALGGQAHKTAWMVTNHPDVTTYNCCAGDPSEKCTSSNPKFSNQRLIESEQTDFVAACWLRTMGAAHPPTPAQAKAQCRASWVSHPTAANKQTLCVQAKLDNNNPQARCGNFEQAWNYCAAHDANACASLDCSYDQAAVKLPLPPASRQPYSADQNCADRNYGVPQ